MRNVAIIGGGLAGLVSAILLNRAGISCILIEKKQYPFHRVCGEYISNEAVPFLKKLNIYPGEFDPVPINRFQLSSNRGHSATLPLDLGGFGISRYTFDNFLFTVARNSGVECLPDTEITEVTFSNEAFTLKTSGSEIVVDVVIGAFGKRSRLDVQMKRKFVARRSPFVGVKYHATTQHPSDLIALHNFNGGYCGVSNVESGKTNICYLTHRDPLKQHGDIDALEEQVLFKNPLIRNIFKNADFLFEKPEVINEVSFETKSPLEQHMLMVGDAAGMIAPLCGNGMAMAIHSAKLASEQVIDFHAGRITRPVLEKRYELLWKQHFAQRLWNGRQIQKLFGSAAASAFAIGLVLHSRPMARWIIRNTHGKPF